MTLEELAEDYVHDRTTMDAAHPPTEIEMCRYCGKYWRPWVGCAFTGHVKCAVSSGFRAKLVVVLEQQATMTYAIVAAKLGVTPAVVQCWWRISKRNPFP